MIRNELRASRNRDREPTRPIKVGPTPISDTGALSSGEPGFGMGLVFKKLMLARKPDRV
jgi:hypothetical protein